jgi:hypothetical protein
MSISLNPKTFVSGGLLNDVDVEIVEARYALFDYQGTVDAANMRTALRLQMRTLDGSQEATEHLTLGATGDFVPNDSDGGLTLRPLSGKTSLTKRSKLYFFLQSLTDAGADMSRLDNGRADELEGLKFHFVRKPMPDMGGLEVTRRGKNPDQAIEYIHVTKLIEWPAKKAAPSAQAPAAASGGPSPEAEAAATEILMELAKPGMTLQRLGMEAMKRSAKLDVKLRNQISRLLVNEQWLSNQGVVVENKQLVLVPWAAEDEVPF